MPADAKNIVKKVLKPAARASSGSESGIRDTVLVNTMAMASEKEKWRNFFFRNFWYFDDFMIFKNKKMRSNLKKLLENSQKKTSIFVSLTIQNTFAKNQHVKHWINVDGMKNGNSCNWINSRNQGAKSKTLNKIHCESKIVLNFVKFQNISKKKRWLLTSIGHIGHSQNVDAASDDKGWNGCADDGECQNWANVLKKVSFVQIVTAFKDDWWQ